MEKKIYEEPTVAKVEFDFTDRIAASGCSWESDVFTIDDCDSSTLFN